MKEAKIKYLLAIDGGGTKTEFLLTDINKNEINRLKLGSTNPSILGFDKTAKVLNNGINEICSGIDYCEISMFAGISGYLSCSIKDKLNDLMSSFGFGNYRISSDIESAVALTLNDSDGIVVIIGTGIVAFAQKDGIRHRIGGWGYLLDKEGSGFSIGAMGLNSALKYADGRGGSKALLGLIENRLQNKLVDSVKDINDKGVSYIASFAREVFEAYKNGDSQALKIIDSNMDSVASLIEASGKYFDNDKTDVYLTGGLCNEAHVIKPLLTNKLNRRFILHFINEPMVTGALNLARKGD